jgi:hypothetical protein
MAKKTSEPCGCDHNGQKWLVMCPPHKAEHDETHLRWWAEHIARQPAGTYLQLEGPPV